MLGRVDEDRLTEQGCVLAASRIHVRLAHRLRGRAGDARGEKGGDVELLPDGEPVFDQDHDLRLERRAEPT